MYTLLALNLGLLTWNLLGPSTDTGSGSSSNAPVAPVAAEMEALPLLSELEQPGLRSRPSQVASTEPQTASVPQSQPTTPSPESPAQASGPPDVFAETSTGAAANLQPPSAPTPAAPETAPIAVQAPVETEPTEPAVVQAETPHLKASCMTLGPLEDKAVISQIQAWLEEGGAQVDVRIDERREVALYWVFFPPRKSRAVAIAEVVRMKEQGIEDIIVVPKGDMANAISLGVYSRPESRDRRVKELTGKGYEPSIGPRYRSKVATWIDVTAREKDGEGVLDRAAVEARWPQVRVTDGACSNEPAQAETPQTSTAVAQNAVAEVETKTRRFHFSGPARKP